MGCAVLSQNLEKGNVNVGFEHIRSNIGSFEDISEQVAVDDIEFTLNYPSQYNFGSSDFMLSCIEKIKIQDEIVTLSTLSEQDAKLVMDKLPKDILKTEVINATNKLGIPSKNVFVYNYQVRKLNYSRQEILEDLMTHRKKLNPDLVLMPSLHHIHQDHATIAQEGLRAFKGSTILGYELIWNNLTFNTTSFVTLDEKHIQQKCYFHEAILSFSAEVS